VSIYRTHWGLRDAPFRDCHDPRTFYQSPTHDEALARLHFLVEQHRRLGLLMGPAGSGKSLVLEIFAGRLRRAAVPVACLSLVGMEPAELLWQLGLAFGLNRAYTDSIARLWRQLTDRLTEFRYSELPAVILLDDADQASAPVLAHVNRLTQHDRTPESRLTLALAGRHDRMARIGSGLLELVELRIDVEPWEPADTRQYLESSLAQAGSMEAIFDDSAVSRLHELSGGIPRRVAQLADLALLAAAGRDLRQVDADVIESVYHELGVACV